MHSQGEGFVGLRGELPDEPRPEEACGAELGDLHERVHADAEEERQTRREDIDVEPGREAGPDVGDAIGQRVGEFEVRRRPGLLHVVAGNRDRIETRHASRCISEDVGDDPHRRTGWIDVGVAHHEFFENIVLDRPGQLLRLDTLLFGRHNIECHDREDGAVHGHGHAHRVEGNAVEQRPHVEDRVDRDPGHADVARDPRVIAVVAAMRREVERDREALLAGREIAAIEGVGILGRGEAGILPDRPRLIDVHGRIGAAQERRLPRETVERLGSGPIVRTVERLDCDALGRDPSFSSGIVHRSRRGCRPPIDGAEIRDGTHIVAPSGSIRSSSRRLGSPPEASGLSGAGRATRASCGVSPGIR